MKYVKAEFPVAIALLVLGLGFAFEHAAIGHGGFALAGLLLVILAAIIGVAFRISHHAEVLALRWGEPYGTLILTLAAVSVEVVILVVLLRVAPNPTLARDTVFAAAMFNINGMLGAAAIIGGLRQDRRNAISRRPTHSSPCCWWPSASGCSFPTLCRMRTGKSILRFPSA
jgi:Ca2+:H+ antiporter